MASPDRIKEVAGLTVSSVLLVVIEGAAHAINFTHPGELANVIRLFMADQPIVDDPDSPGVARSYEIYRGPPSPATGGCAVVSGRWTTAHLAFHRPAPSRMLGPPSSDKMATRGTSTREGGAMSTAAWIIVAIVTIPVLVLLGWMVMAASLVRVPSGSLGLLLVKGRATDTTLLPGPHFVPALRRKMVENYTSVEMSYRAGGPPLPDDGVLDRSGPPLDVTLGDRTTATVAYTVRFRLIPAELRQVHERFGPDGVFGIVRDASSAAATATLRDPSIGVDDMCGPALEQSQQVVRAAVADALAANGIEMAAFVLGVADLGRTGEVIQATMRARLEVEREQAQAATRLASALNDVELQQRLTLSDEAAWRYRQIDLLSDLLQHSQALQLALREAWPGAPGAATTALVQDDASSPTAQP